MKRPLLHHLLSPSFSTFWLLLGCLILGGSLPLNHAFAETTAQRQLKRAVSHYDQLQFDKALALLKNLSKSSDLSPKEKAKASLYKGFCLFFMQGKEAARGDIRSALQRERNLTLPTQTPPPLRALFQEEKAKLPPPPRRIEPRRPPPRQVEPRRPPPRRPTSSKDPTNSNGTEPPDNREEPKGSDRPNTRPAPPRRVEPRRPPPRRPKKQPLPPEEIKIQMEALTPIFPGRTIQFQGSCRPHPLGSSLSIYIRKAGDQEYKRSPLEWNGERCTGAVPNPYKTDHVGEGTIEFYIEVKSLKGQLLHRSHPLHNPAQIQLTPNKKPSNWWVPVLIGLGTAAAAAGAIILIMHFTEPPSAKVYIDLGQGLQTFPSKTPPPNHPLFLHTGGR